MTSSIEPSNPEAKSWSHIAPIFNLASEVNSFSLGPLTIRRLTDRERDTIARPAGEISLTLFAEMSAAKYGICGTESRIGNAAYQFDESCADVVTALRLVRDGAVYVNLFWSWITDSQSQTSLRTPMQPIVIGAEYHLDPNDLELLSNIFAALPLAVEKKKGLRRAVRRFNFAYQRSEQEDRLIDFWIALEGLFLVGASSELRFRAALRIAHFIGQSAAERWSTFVDMKKSYDLRSSIVHGARVEMEEVKAVTRRTEEILRRALRDIILDPKKFDPESLDRRAVEGGR